MRKGKNGRWALSNSKELLCSFPRPVFRFVSVLRERASRDFDFDDAGL